MSAPGMRALFQHRMMKFAVVGGVGFVVDAAMFAFCLYALSMPMLWARSVAFICAASTTWLGNRCFTFRSLTSQSGKRRRFEQWLKFIGCALISAIPNFVMFQTVILILGEQGIKPFVALIAGIIAGMMSNYLLSRHFVFK